MQTNAKKIIDNRTIWLLFGLCWFVYFISYIGRMNYSAAMPDMIASFWLTMQQAGSLSTAFFVCYAAGQFINGLLADQTKPENLIFIGLGLSSFVNFFMPLAPSYFFALALWALNGYALSMLWPSIIRIIADMFEARTMIKCGVHIASSMAAGSLSAYLLASLLIRFIGWQAVFFVAFVLLLTICIIWHILFKNIKKRREKYGVTQLAEQEKIISPATVHKKNFTKYLFGSGIFILLLPVAVHGAIKDGVTAWIPTMLTQTFAAPAYAAVLAVSLLPIVNLSGAYMANYLFKWVKNEILCASVFFTLALVGISGIIFLDSSTTFM